MEAPNSVYERLSLSYEVRVLEIKAEFFRRLSKLHEYLAQLEELSVPSLPEICKFLKDTYEVALSDHEAAIFTGVWQTPVFVETYTKALDKTLSHAEKLLIRHLKAKNKSETAAVLAIISGLPGSIDITKALFLSILELLSEDYNDSLFENSDDPMVEQVSMYTLQRGNLWQLSSGRTPGNRWLLYKCDQSCYQGDFYLNCFPAFYKAVLADIYHVHVAYRHCLQSQMPYSFLSTASEILQVFTTVLQRKRPNTDVFITTLRNFRDARERLELEGFASANLILTPAYVSFATLIQTAANYFAREVESNAQGDSTIHKLMWLYGHLSEFIYTFFSMHPSGGPYLERLVSQYEMEWEQDSVTAARENDLLSVIQWLRYLRCHALELYKQCVERAVSTVCQTLTSTTYSQPSQSATQPFIVQLIDLITAHYEHADLLGRSNRVMLRKTLAVFCSVLFKVTRRTVKRTCRVISSEGVERLTRDIAALLDAICSLSLVRVKAGYAQKLRGLREVLKWRDALESLLKKDSQSLPSKLLLWWEKVPERSQVSQYPDVSILQMQVAR